MIGGFSRTTAGKCTSVPAAARQSELPPGAHARVAACPLVLPPWKRLTSQIIPGLQPTLQFQENVSSFELGLLSAFFRAPPRDEPVIKWFSVLFPPFS